MYINTYNKLYKYNKSIIRTIEKPELTRDWLSGDPFKYGLLGHYKSIGNVSALGTWNDISGNGNDATLYNNTFIDFNGANFDSANNDVIRINSTNNFNVSSITLSAWIKPDGTQENNGKIIEKDYSGAASPFISYGLDINAGNTDKFAFELSADGSITGVNSTTTYSSGIWFFIVGVWDGSYLYIYINGISDASPVAKSGTLNFDNTKYLRIGNSRYETAERFNGIIDDVRIYNRALSQQEIQNLYLKTKRP